MNVISNKKFILLNLYLSQAITFPLLAMAGPRKSFSADIIHIQLLKLDLFYVKVFNRHGAVF
jgi:hypothetical protein